MSEVEISKKSSVRELALFCLQQIKKGALIQEALDGCFKKELLGQADKNFITDLVAGYLRNIVRINYILSRLLRRPGRLAPLLADLLGLGVYSLLFQDKIPDYAAVNETVKLARKIFGAKMASLVNAVLRNLQRLGDAPHNFSWYSENLDEWEANCVFYGIPRVIADLWREAYGPEKALYLLRRSSQRPWSGVRFNSTREEARKLCASLFEGQGRKRLGEWAWAFAPGKLPEELGGRSFRELESDGLLSFQSPASMLVMANLGLASWKKPVWDCCSGSGIKLSAMLECGAPVFLASDVSRRRLANIRPFCHRLGLPVPNVALASAAQPPLREWSGNIIADVPCSGLGTLARRPDLRLGFLNGGKSINKHVPLQRNILSALVTLLKKGGELAYITCTLNPDENGLQIQTILRKFPDLELVAEWQTPHDHEWLEGMYGAILKKS